MPEFFNVLPPDDARELMFKHLPNVLPGEHIYTTDALGRVTSTSVRAPHSLPSFYRSTMDGYAVHAVDTYGATGSLPAFIEVIGEVLMGAPSVVNVGKGQAVIVHTGGMIPSTTDAVVQVEHTQTVGDGPPQRVPSEIEVFKPVAVGQNVLTPGEDVKTGELVLPEGHQIRPQDQGGLLALGITQLKVARKPNVAILATGDEVVNPDREPLPGQIRDINSYTIAGQTRQAGGIPILLGISPDSFAGLLKTASQALADNDMLVISAGSSVSNRDITAKVIDQLGEPGVLLHGVATRPGKPTIVAAIEGKPILGLPGNPVSAMVQFAMFGMPAIYHLQGLHVPPRRGIVWAKVNQNIASESGREDYVAARLFETSDGLIAEPVFGKSNLIYTLVKADGLIKVPLNKGGVSVGEWVEVTFF